MKKLTLPRETLIDLETHLQAEKRRISAQIKDLSAQDPFHDTDRLTDNAASDTEASEETNHERYQAMVDELNNKLQEIESAISRIQDGSYGLCLSCHNLIDTDRLAAMPTATLCMDCQKKRSG